MSSYPTFSNKTSTFNLSGRHPITCPSNNIPSSARPAEQTTFKDEIIAIKPALKLQSLVCRKLPRLCALLDRLQYTTLHDIWPFSQLLQSFMDIGKNLPFGYVRSNRHYHKNI